jgi:sulfur carrier protein
MITLTVNGKKETIAPGTTVSGYLALKKIDPAVVVVEINEAIVKKDDFGTTAFNNKDTVEILRFVGGG